MYSESVNKSLKTEFITSTNATTPVAITVNLSKYDFLILRVCNSTGTTIYGSDIIPVNAINDNDIINILRYFNVLSGNFTGTLTHSTGNSFTLGTSSSNYLLQLYGVLK